MNSAEVIFMIARYWLMVGGVVAAVFLTIGIDRIDEDARGAYIFRSLLVTGVLLIWPLVLWRWTVLEMGRDRPGDRYKPVRAAHRMAAVVMAIGIVVSVALGLSVRQNWPADIAPERLSAVGEDTQ